ncbi:MAG: alpha-galactosidase, partial [Victivallaceae bacterium]|nr:alpha-galactosidase [Victivallaceae bacterium]
MYLNYKRFSVEINPRELTLSAAFRPLHCCEEFGFLRNGAFSIRSYDGAKLDSESFSHVQEEKVLAVDRIRWKVIFSGGPVSTPELEIGCEITAHAVLFSVNGRATATLTGDLCWSNEVANTFAVRSDCHDSILRTGIGPAIGADDDALFDREQDKMLLARTAGTFQLGFDWTQETYTFRYTHGIDYGRTLEFKVRENDLATRFQIPYRMIDKSHHFATPPVGWMTWYAVQFAASEEVVLRNAEKLKELFGRYSAKLVLWVDWEWCHRCWDGQGEEGADIFHPRQSAYPHGLKFVSDKLREKGLIPALWIGATNEGRKNQMLLDHPDWILGKHAMWCGQYWLDLSNPEVLEKYIPAVFEQILKWGYEVVKWDCLPATLEMNSLFHDKFKRPERSPEQVLRDAAQAARKTLGPEIYMLSCAGDSERDISGAMDFFSAARVGGDIFGWTDFIEQAIGRVMRCYMWHNTAFYNDADNLIVRAELNTLERARSRISFYGLTGLPITLGDPLEKLDEARVEMICRILPTVDVHPRDLVSKTHDSTCQILHLAIHRPFAQWSVVGVINLEDEAISRVIQLGGVQVKSVMASAESTFSTETILSFSVVLV